MIPWEDIEKEPEFEALTPEDRASLFDEWKGGVLSAAADEDPETIDPVGINQFVATSNARRRSLLEGTPFDEAAALQEYQQSLQTTAQKQADLLRRFNEAETARFRVNDLTLAKGVGATDLIEQDTLDKPLEDARAAAKAIEDTFAPGQMEQAKAAREALRGERSAAVLDGEIVVDPALTLNSSEYRDAVKAADASPEAKARALAAFQQNKKQFLRASLSTLRAAGEAPLPGMTSFATWESELPPEEYRKPPEEKVANYLREMKDRGGFRKLTSAIGTALMQGGADVATQGIGVAAMASGSPELAEQASQVSQGAELMGEASRLEGDLSATGATTAAGVARMAVPIVPTIGAAALTGGGVPVAAAVAGLQTAGSQFPSTYSALREQGKTEEEALSAARGSALLSGTVTAALTAVGGATGIEGILRQGGQKVVRSRLIEALKAVPGGALKEIPEELTDELASQIIEQKTLTPDKPVSQIIDEFTAQAPDLALQVALLGGAGEAVGTLRGTEVAPPPAPTVATPPPAQPAAATATPEVAANVAEADMGMPQTAGTPVTLDGQNYTISIPPESTIAPETVAGFYDDPDTLRALADRGDIRLEQVITPAETVDTTPLNDNLAVSAALAPETVAAVAEATAEEPILPAAVTTAQETPVAPAESGGGSLGQSSIAAGGSIPAVTEPTVPQTTDVSSPEIEAAADPFAPVAEAVAPETGAEVSPTRPPASEQTFVETPDKKWGWEVTDQLGGKAYGSITDGTAKIVGMDSVPITKAYTEEGERLKRRGFLRTLVNTLRSKGARRLKVSMQSADTRKALARLVETGELTNPREMTGISVDEHPTLFDIPQPPIPPTNAPAPQIVETAPRPVRKRRSARGIRVEGGIPPSDLGADDTAAGTAPTPLTAPLRPKFEAGETVTFKVNGQPVIGTIQRVSGGGNATVTYNWNGKKDQEIVLRTSEIQRPVLALAEAPNYKYTQEQNTRKAARFGIPTEPGVTVNAAPVITSALERIASDTAMPPMLRAVARALQRQNYEGVDLRIVADGRLSYAGQYLAKNGRGVPEIELNMRAVGRGQTDAVATLLHELLHHVTLAKIRDPQGEVETQAVEALDTLRKRIKAYAGMQQKATKFSYELGTVDEFITALFTRPDFQDFIAGIPDTFVPGTPGSKFRSVLSEIFRIIAQLVTGQKVQKGGMLDQAFASSLTLFETPQRAARGAGVDYSVAEKPRTKEDILSEVRKVDEESARILRSRVQELKAQFPGKVVALRFGELPDDFVSTGVSDRGRLYEEAGVSTYGLLDVEGAQLQRENNTIGDTLVSVKDRQPYILVGDLSDAKGRNQEPLLRDIVHVEPVSPKLIAGFAEQAAGRPQGSFGAYLRGVSADIRFSATDEAPAEPVFTPDEARAILTKRFGKAVADKIIVEVMAPRRMGNREVEVDAELRGGMISLNLKFMDTEDILVQKAEHEMAHAVYSDKGVQDAWRDLSVSMPPEVRQRITDRMKEAGYDPRVLNEEVLVRFLEEVRANTSPSKWKAFMDAVIDAFRRFFGAMPDERTARLAAARIIAAGEAAVARGLDPSKQAFGQSVSDLIGAMDAEYLAAVEAGDMEKAQRMVDEAAKAAGYTSRVFHGTVDKEPTELSKSFEAGEGVFTTDNPDVAHIFRFEREYGGVITEVYDGDADEYVEVEPGALLELYVRPGKQLDLSKTGIDPQRFTDDTSLQARTLREAMRDGYDSILVPDVREGVGEWTEKGTTTILFKTSDLKRSDPVTRDDAGNVIPLSKRFGPSPDIRFSVATQRDYAFQRNLTGEAAEMKNLATIRPWKETVRLAREIIEPYKKADTSKDKMAGRREALQRLMTDTSIDPNVRAAGFMQLALETDTLASVAKTPEQQAAYDDFSSIPAAAYGVIESSIDPASVKFDSVSQMMEAFSQAGRMLNTARLVAAMTPDGFIRKSERVRRKKVDEATEQQFGTSNVMSEIEKLWRMMQEAGATDRGLAIAAALRAFMPSRKNAAALIEKLFPQANIRERMTKGGEGLVRDFFQMIAGPRDPKGPLAEFDESIQSALSSMLRKVMEARGLVAENQTTQASDIDKLVRSVSADPLRFDKIAAADAAMQDELAKIDDAERRATLQQAWEEATSKMYTTIANDATARRAVNAELKAEGVKWNELFDKGQKPTALRAKIVDAVMQKVGALTDATDSTVKANLDMLRTEVGAAFDFIAETKRVQWLAYRAGVEARRRVAERRKDMLAALRNRGVAEGALARLNEKLAGPPRPGADPNPVSTLIGEHIKSPVEGFTDKLVALGVEKETADALDAVAATVRADAEKLAQAVSVDAAIRRLTERMAGPPRPGRPANAVADLVNKHIREPMSDFSEKLAALGAMQSDIDALVSLTDRVRRDNLEKRLFNSLKPKTRAAKSAIPRLLRVLLEAGKTGAFDSKAFNDALAEAFNFPPMTAEQDAEIRRMVAEINKLPMGAARVDKQQELQNYVAMVQGIPARDVLMSALYANWLSGLSTQAIGLAGNSANLGLRSFFIAMTNNPEDVKNYFRGALGIGAKAGFSEAKAALGNLAKLVKGQEDTVRGQFKVGRLDSPQIANALEVLFRKGPTTPAEWVAYIASIGTRTRAVFRLMMAIDSVFWNSAREGMYHLAASRTVRKMAKEQNMTKEEANAEFIRQLGGGPEVFEAALKDAEAALKEAGQPADMATITRMAYEAINRIREKENPEAVKEANRFADRIVFQAEPEGIGRLISKIISALQQLLTPFGFPLGQMLVPFNKIVSSLFEQSLDYTGLGLVRGVLGMHLSDARIDWSKGVVPHLTPAQNAKMFSDVERRERAMAGFVGLTLSAAAYLAAKSHMDDDDDEVPFMLYAFGPSDKNKREQMPAGWVPFSIKVGDTYYRYAEWPLGMVLAGFAAALDAERYGNMKEKDTMDRIGYSAMLGLKGFMTQGVLSNVDTAIDALMFKATGKKYTDIPVNAAKGLIPAQGFLRDISSLFDNTKVSNDDVMSALLRDVPFAKSLGTKPQLNVFGEPVEMEGEAILRRFLTQRRPHPTADYLTRNKLYIPGMAETVDVGDYLPASERDRFKRRAMQMAAMDNGVFTPEQNYAFRKRAGELTKSAVERIMKQAPAIKTEEQRKAVQNLIDKQVALARRRAMVEAVPYQPPPAQ